MLQQNEGLNLLKGTLKEHGVPDSLAENLFYGITPSEFQGKLDNKLLVSWFLFLVEGMKLPHKVGHGYSLLHKAFDGWLALVVRVERESCREVIGRVLHEHLELQGEVAHTFLEVGETTFFGYLIQCRDIEQQNETVRHLERELRTWSGRRSSKERLRLNLSVVGPSLDPCIGTDQSPIVGSDRRSGAVIKMLFEGLMQIDQRGKPICGIAEDVKISEDQLRYTFSLRKALWSNGQPITAHHFEYAWKRQLDPRFQSHRIQLFYPIKNVEKIKLGLSSIDAVGVRAESDSKLVVDLEYPTPYFLEHCAHWIYSPVYPPLVEKHPDWAYSLDESYVCNGPFRPIKQESKSQIALVKNPHYWDADTVTLPGLEITMIQDPHTSLALFENGAIDWIGEPLCDLPVSQIERLRQHNKIEYMPSDAIYWCCFNTSSPPFRSTKLRRAFAQSCDRQSLVDTVLLGDEFAAASVLPPSISIDPPPPIPYPNLEGAQQLFAEGLKELELEPSIDLTLHFPRLGNLQAVAEALANQWSQAFGVEVVAKGLSLGVFLESILNQDFDLTLAPFYSWYTDPLCLLGVLKSRAVSFNISRWENEEYTRLINEAERCLDFEKRCQFVRELEAFLQQEVPVIPIYSHRNRYLKGEDLHNVTFSEVGQVNFKWTFLGLQ